MKFAQVGYGTDGEGAGEDGKGYTYVVNDNVRTGDTLSPAVRHYKSGALFATTGKVLTTVKSLETKRGQEVAERLDEAGVAEDNLTTAYTSKDVGVTKTLNFRGRSTHDENGEYIAGTRERIVRAENVLRAQQEGMARGLSSEISQGEKTTQAFRTYDDYIKAYGGK